MAIDALLAATGVTLFVYLVVSSGVTLDLLVQAGASVFALLLAVSASIILVETQAWRLVLGHVTQAPIAPLVRIRLGGNALTNGIPGGFVLGETFKAMMLRRRLGVPLANGAASLLAMKFGLGLSQALFISIGLGTSYPLLRARSTALVGFEGAHLVGLGLAIAMGCLMLAALWLLARGNTISALVGRLGRLPIARLRHWLRQHHDGINELDERFATLYTQRARIARAFCWLFVGWLVSSLEGYVILGGLTETPTLRTAFVLESVGSLFRLLLFMVPSGIGVQDVTLFALFSLHRLPKAQAGAYVLIKRVKELFWIGIGLSSLLALRSA